MTRLSIFQGGGDMAVRYQNWLAACFRKQDWDVLPLPRQFMIRNLGNILLSIHFIPELARLAKAIRKPYVCWVMDMLLNVNLLNPDWVSEWTVIFDCSRGDLERFRAAGYSNVFYLPVSVDSAIWRERPPARSPDLSESRGSVAGEPVSDTRYPVSFVGNCYELDDNSEFQKYRRAWLARGLSPELGLNTLEQFIPYAARHLIPPVKRLFFEFIQSRQPDFFEKAPIRGEFTASPDLWVSFFVDVLLCHEWDAPIRGALAQAMAPLGMHLWGLEPGWRPFLGEGIHYHGMADMERDFAGIIAATDVCVNIPRRHSDALLLRNFEIPACAGFQLSLFSDDLAAAFAPDKEIVMFESIPEAVDKARYFIAHETERRRIAEKGRLRFLKEHTLAHRFQAMEQTLRGLGVM
ncbi:MAG: glycosyltransferase [Lentisphaerae bacterium]|nr:glycosyltransferase [Lentisphaerota bacterium]